MAKQKIQDIHAQNLHILKDRIKTNQIDGCYIFYGDEEYTKDHYAGLIAEKAGSNLNITSIYGKDFTLEGFIAACETSAVESVDMFSIDSAEDESDTFRVVKLFSPDLSSLSDNDMDFLKGFLKSLPEKTVVIFWFYTGADESHLKNDFYKAIDEFALTVNFKREAVGSSILITWILRHFSKSKINVDRYIAVHLCQTVGNSMTDLKNEIDKLIDYLRFENRDTLEKKDVDFICIKSTEAQFYDIADGALQGNFVKSSRALTILRNKQNKDYAPAVIAGSIAKAVNTLCYVDGYIKGGMSLPAIAEKLGTKDFVVKKYSGILTDRARDFRGKSSFPQAATRLCIEYDRKIKSSSTNGHELLLELLFKLSYAGKTVS